MDVLYAIAERNEKVSECMGQKERASEAADEAVSSGFIVRDGWGGNQGDCRRRAVRARRRSEAVRSNGELRGQTTRCRSSG